MVTTINGARKALALHAFPVEYLEGFRRAANNRFPAKVLRSDIVARLGYRAGCNALCLSCNKRPAGSVKASVALDAIRFELANRRSR